MKLSISRIHAAAADRPAGYVQDVLSHGEVSGEWLVISNEALAQLREKYRMGESMPEMPRAKGLGDLVSKVATPLARALRLPCIDPETNNLRPESSCAKRRDALNAALPSGGGILWLR